MLTPSCSKSVSCPSNSQKKPRPGRSRHSASRAFRTNQPGPVGTRPCSPGSRPASSVTGPKYVYDRTVKVEATEVDGRKVYSVHSFNRGLASWLGRLPTLWIEGEV